MNIKTIVYFDLESTGLQDSGRPRISELSFLAVKTEEFLKLHSEIIDDISKKKKYWKTSKNYQQTYTLCLSDGFSDTRCIINHWIGQLQPLWTSQVWFMYSEIDQ